MTQPAVPAGGYHRKALDNTWRTPEWLLDCVRAYFGGPIPFDAASAPDNPTQAAVYCVPPAGPLFAEFDPQPETRQLTLVEPHEAELVGEKLVADALEIDWPCDRFWVNPPYGGHLYAWLEKIARSGQDEGRQGVALIPTSRWETAKFQAFLAKADVITFVRKRVAFVSSRDGKPVKGNTSGSMLVGFNPAMGGWIEAFGDLGLTIQPEVIRG